MRWAGLLSLVLLAAVTGGLAVYAKQHETTLHLPFLPQPPAKALEYRVTISPGDTEVERGASLVVTARFEGPIPDNATLLCQSDDEDAVRVPMSLSLSDPLFGGHLADLQIGGLCRFDIDSVAGLRRALKADMRQPAGRRPL